MTKKEHLTNERLQGKFLTNFDLANYAISRARNELRQDDICPTLEVLIEDLERVPQLTEEEKKHPYF